MGLKALGKIVAKILGGGITGVIGQMMFIIDDALNFVKFQVLEISLTTIIRDAEGKVIDAIQLQKLNRFQRIWEKCRRILAKCGSRFDKVVKLARKIQPIISIVRRILRIVSKVSRFLPVGGAAIAEAAVKIEKILGVIETILRIIILWGDVIRSICARLLAILKSLMTQLDITEDQEREWVEDEDRRPDEYMIFNIEYDIELIELEQELDVLDSLRDPQNAEECRKRLNDVMWVINDLDKFVGDIEQLRMTQRTDGWLDIPGASETLNELLDESYDELTNTRSYIDSIKREFLAEIQNLQGYKGNQKPFEGEDSEKTIEDNIYTDIEGYYYQDIDSVIENPKERVEVYSPDSDTTGKGVEKQYIITRSPLLEKVIRNSKIQSEQNKTELP